MGIKLINLTGWGLGKLLKEIEGNERKM